MIITHCSIYGSLLSIIYSYYRTTMEERLCIRTVYIQLLNKFYIFLSADDNNTLFYIWKSTEYYI